MSGDPGILYVPIPGSNSECSKYIFLLNKYKLKFYSKYKSQTNEYYLWNVWQQIQIWILFLRNIHKCILIYEFFVTHVVTDRQIYTWTFQRIDWAGENTKLCGPISKLALGHLCLDKGLTLCEGHYPLYLVLRLQEAI